ncbi:MAG: histidine phosphatase family protein [Clostridia bacterium]|nr:histidine phosphatase family protein [Clostridia bacterium]
MTRMIFVRHGESMGNINDLFYGHTDGELTELGRRQALCAAKYLKDVHIDVAYASDLKRAFETGEIIAKEHKLEPIPEKGLREIFAGEWENKHFTTLAELYPEEYSVWMKDMWNAHPLGGESIKQMTDRIRETVWKIAEENDGKTVLVAFHSTPIRSLVCEWNDLPYEKINEVGWVKNASVSIVNYDVEKHTTAPEVIGYADFLGDLAKEVSSKV